MNIDSLHHLELVRKVVLQLPQVEEYICFSMPAFRVKKKLLARLKEDGETLLVHCNERDTWMQQNQSIFFITDDHSNYPTVLVSLAKIEKKDLNQLLINAWKEIAPKRLLKEYIRKEESNYYEFRNNPLIIILICGLIIISIGLFLTLSNSYASGIISSGRFGQGSGHSVPINGPATIITGILLSLFPAYQLIQNWLKTKKN